MVGVAEEVDMTVMHVREQPGTPLPLVELVVRDRDVVRGTWLQVQLDEVLRVRPRRLVVDLTACTTLDASALRALLEAHRQQRRQDGVLVLRGLSERLVRVVGLSGLGDVFDVEGHPRRSPGAVPMP